MRKESGQLLGSDKPRRKQEPRPEKCFDMLWAKECFNDVFENEIKKIEEKNLDDNFCIKVAVNTHSGITRSVTKSDNIMHRTVLSLKDSVIYTIVKQAYRQLTS